MRDLSRERPHRQMEVRHVSEAIRDVPSPQLTSVPLFIMIFVILSSLQMSIVFTVNDTF